MIILTASYKQTMVPDLLTFRRFDDIALAKEFSNLGTHILVIRLAAEGKLKGQSQDFKKYVFPEKINGIIDTKIKALQAELSKNS